jgi:hypothetical protein
MGQLQATTTADGVPLASWWWALAVVIDWGSIAAFFDARQRAWRHLLHLRGGLSTALVSARPGGENVADVVTRQRTEVSDGGTSSGSREAESVAGVARPLWRAAALVWSGSIRRIHGPRPLS